MLIIYVFGFVDGKLIFEVCDYVFLDVDFVVFEDFCRVDFFEGCFVCVVLVVCLYFD